MANHVIRDRIWESKKLQRCSREAALAYPWVFLVADDWGRFEYDPRRIWSKVFGGRQDISTDEVAAWLGEYVRVGLLILYKEGELAFWYRFEGRPPSKRRPSLHTDPKADKKVPIRKRTGTLPVPDRYPLADQESRAGEQSRSGAEVAPAAAVAAPAALVPVEKPWSQEACDDWARHLGTPPGGPIGAALKPLLAKHGWHVVQPVWRWACERAAASDAPEKWSPQGFARSFDALLKRFREEGAGLVRAGPNHGVKPTSGERTVDAVKRFGGGG